MTNGEPAQLLGRWTESSAPGDYSEYYRRLERLFASISVKPRIAVACDSVSSMILEVEAGGGIAVAHTMLKLTAGRPLLYRPLSGTIRGTQASGVL